MYSHKQDACRLSHWERHRPDTVEVERSAEPLPCRECCRLPGYKEERVGVNIIPMLEEVPTLTNGSKGDGRSLAISQIDDL